MSGACLAELGNDVICLDVDPNKIAILQQAGVPICESGLGKRSSRNNVAARYAASSCNREGADAPFHFAHYYFMAGQGTDVQSFKILAQ